jgi:hypothetical protein
MADMELNRTTVALYFKSAAYHEAGHITAAVLQEMPLQQRGIHVDTEASGISYYCHRSPGTSARSEADQLERERTIIALYAGIAAQTRFFSDCPEDDWASDRATIRTLLEEMLPADSEARSTAQNNLREKAEQLVSQYWPMIEGLTSTLLAKPETPLPPIEVENKWSHGKKGVEKWMRGSEVVEFFGKFGIVAIIRQTGLERGDEIR